MVTRALLFVDRTKRKETKMQCAICRRELHERYYAVDVYDSIKNERYLVNTCLDCARRFEHGQRKFRYRVTIRRQNTLVKLSETPLRAFAKPQVDDLL